MDNKNIYIVGEDAEASVGVHLAELQRATRDMGREIVFVDSEEDIPFNALEVDVAPLPDIKAMITDMEAMTITAPDPMPEPAKPVKVRGSDIVHTFDLAAYKRNRLVLQAQREAQAQE